MSSKWRVRSQTEAHAAQEGQLRPSLRTGDPSFAI
ncbi:hypothetical protein SAMN05444680_116125 [Variovorax sp. YR216]|nr:hypothetical protein SAMN05444680_116125 [Variovorax sp. YR216]